MTSAPELTTNADNPGGLNASGAWTVANVEALERLCDGAGRTEVRSIDISRVTALDTVGAWLFERLARRGTGASSEAVFTGIAGFLRIG